jgi:hypothetical protein
MWASSVIAHNKHYLIDLIFAQSGHPGFSPKKTLECSIKHEHERCKNVNTTYVCNYVCNAC